MSKKRNSVLVSKVSLSLSLEADCAQDRTQGLFHRLLAISSAAQMVCSWCCRILVDILRCFSGGWPRAFCSSVVYAAAASCYSGAPHLGCIRLVRWSPFSVATCTFQVDTGNSGGSGRSVMRGTEAPLWSSSSAAAAGR